MQFDNLIKTRVDRYGFTEFRYSSINVLKEALKELGVRADTNDKKELVKQFHVAIGLGWLEDKGAVFTSVSLETLKQIKNAIESKNPKNTKESEEPKETPKEVETKMPLPPNEETEEYAIEWKLGSDVNKHWPDIPVPVFSWKKEKPEGIPEKNKSYFFRKDKVEQLLYSILGNTRAYLYGHTGTGKTTLIEQIAAWLNIPFVRINFDSEISRFDLIGRDVLKIKEGSTVSEFVHGLIPSAMKRPCLACFDEIDFCRPDVAYVMQSVLEGNQLLIPENGNEVIKPHKWFRMFATGNTKGRGDSSGIYIGARVQSAALLDRFGLWIEIPFMSKAEAKSILRDTGAAAYYEKHNKDFEGGALSAPVTIRSMSEYVKAKEYLGTEKAFESVVLRRFPDEERGVINEIKERVSL